MLIQLTLKTTNVTYVMEFAGDTRIVKVREEAAKRFRLPAEGIKLLYNDKVLDLEESVCVQLSEMNTIDVELDENSFKSNDNQKKIERLRKKLSESYQVNELYKQYKKDKKLTMHFILQAVDKLHISNRILKLVEDIKNIQTNKLAAKIEDAEISIQSTSTYYPESYLSFVVGDDHFLLSITEIIVAQGNEEVSKVYKAVTNNGMQPLALTGPEHEKFPLLTELEQRNIKTSYIESLFTELAVMFYFIQEIVQSMKQQQYEDYLEADKMEDLEHTGWAITYNLMELIDIKDMLLGQYIDRDQFRDMQKIIEEANTQSSAETEAFRKVYGEELGCVRLYIQGRDVSDGVILQLLSNNNGNVPQTLEQIKQMK